MRDVEAHVRVLLDARLNEWGARLDPQLYDEALTYLVTKAWELSGLDDHGRQRIGWRVRVFTDPEEVDDGDRDVDDRGWFAREESALSVAAAIGEQSPGVIVEISEEPPPGAYDAALGLSFSTYSRRILSMRVVDWYRSTFGDSRYGGRRQHVSLEAIAERYEAEGEAPEQFLEALMPGGADLLDDVLTNVALAR